MFAKEFSNWHFLDKLYEKDKHSCKLIKFANCFDSSAKPETLSITMSWSRFVSTPKLLFTILSDKLISIALVLTVFERALNSSKRSLNVSNPFGWWNSLSLEKQGSTSASLSEPNLMLDNHSTFFNVPKSYLQPIFVWNISFHSQSFQQLECFQRNLHCIVSVI